MPIKSNVETLIIQKALEYCEANNHPIQALWFGEETYSCGGLLSEISKIDGQAYHIKFSENMLKKPKVKDFLIFRVFFLFSPFIGKIKAINDDKSFIIEGLSFIPLKNNKRRYPRFILNNNIEAQMMIGNLVFTVELNDISKDGIGFLLSSERNMLGLLGKSGFIQLNYNNVILRVSGNIVWINRLSRNGYIGGMLLYTNNQDKDIITDIIFDNIFKIETELFKFMSFVSCSENLKNIN